MVGAGVDVAEAVANGSVRRIRNNLFRPKFVPVVRHVPENKNGKHNYDCDSPLPCLLQDNHVVAALGPTTSYAPRTASMQVAGRTR